MKNSIPYYYIWVRMASSLFLLPLHLEVPLRQLYSLSIEKYLTIDIWLQFRMIFGHYSESNGVLALSLFQLLWRAKMINSQHYELHPGVAVSQRAFPVWLWSVAYNCTTSKDLNIKTTSKQVYKFCTISTHTKGQGWISTQIKECDLPLCVCAYASCASKGLKW